MKKTAILFGIVGVFALFGCAPKEEATSTETGGDPVVETPAGDSGGMELATYTNEEGDIVCPVMKGNKVASPDTAQYYDHEGTRYYFCCAGCPEKFEADPDAYISAVVEDEE